MYKLPFGIRLLNGTVRAISTVYRILFGRLDDNRALRRGDRFLAEVRNQLDPLITKYNGSARIVWPRKMPPPFGYLMVEAEFPDRRLTFVRGRSEFYVTLDEMGEAITVFSVSMPSGTGDNGKDGGALTRSVEFLTRHWKELPNLTRNELYQFNMQSR